MQIRVWVKEGSSPGVHQIDFVQKYNGWAARKPYNTKPVGGNQTSE
ncbi:MAG: hypothetical protein OXN17_23305 [Candidatus Poribacteria bacterium]|nr:hypothetical protein [Candidatus Poribacteria bacterium]